MSETISKSQKRTITIVSIVLPLAVAALFGVEIEGYNFNFLPPIYATINGLTAILLVLALVAIKRKNITLHERFITMAMGLSVLFLVMYVAYHITSETTKYGGEGAIAIVYYFILISHIVLSVVVIPLVLFSFLYGKARAIESHKKLVKFAFPLWLYVALSGVAVYAMISPYYT